MQRGAPGPLRQCVPRTVPIVWLCNHSVMSNSLQPQGLQQARLPSPSLSLGVCSNLSIESVMPSNHLILYTPFSSSPQSFPASGSFSNESTLCIRRPKYWSFSFSISRSFSFSISPSEERTNSIPGVSTGERRNKSNSATLG